MQRFHPWVGHSPDPLVHNQFANANLRTLYGEILSPLFWLNPIFSVPAPIPVSQLH